MSIKFFGLVAVVAVTAGCGSGPTAPASPAVSEQPHRTAAREDCWEIDRLVEDLTWIGDGRLLLSLTDDEFAATLAVLDTESGGVEELVEAGFLPPPISASHEAAVWSVSDAPSTAVWTGADAEPRLLFETPLPLVLDLAWTERGIIAVSSLPGDRTQLVRLAGDGSLAAVIRDVEGLAASEVWASLDGSLILSVETPSPERAPGARQRVVLWRDGAPLVIELPGEGGSRFSMSNDGRTLFYRDMATAALVAYDPVTRDVRTLANDVDAGAVSETGRVAAARRSGIHADSQVCLSGPRREP